MPVAAAIVGGVAAIGGGIIASSGAKSAANTAAAAQTAANDKAIAEQQRQYNQTRTDLSPWMGAGQGALSQQMALLGLGGTAGTPGTVNWAAYAQANPELMAAYNAQPGNWFQQANAQVTADPSHAVGTVFGSLLGRVFGGNIGQTAKPDLNTFAQQWYKTHGNGADLSSYTTGGTPGTTAAQAQQAAIDQLKNSPLYESLFRNGEDALLQNASATGGLRGGNTQGALANFGRDTLAQVYANQLNNLSGVSGQGQNAAAGLGGLGANMAATNAQLLNNSGAAAGNAAYAIGGANAGLAQTIGGAGANLANALFANKPSAVTAPAINYLTPSVKSVMDSNPAIF